MQQGLRLEEHHFFVLQTRPRTQVLRVPCQNSNWDTPRKSYTGSVTIAPICEHQHVFNGDPTFPLVDSTNIMWYPFRPRVSVNRKTRDPHHPTYPWRQPLRPRWRETPETSDLRRSDPDTFGELGRGWWVNSNNADSGHEEMCDYINPTSQVGIPWAAQWLHREVQVPFLLLESMSIYIYYTCIPRYTSFYAYIRVYIYIYTICHMSL